MADVWTILFNGLMVVTTLWIVNKFLGTFCEKRNPNFYSVLLWGGFASFQIFVQSNNGIASVWTTLINLFLIVLISMTGYYGLLKTNIIVALLFCVMWALAEMIVFFGMAALPMRKQDTDVLGAVISKIIMIIGVYLFSLLWKRTEKEYIPIRYFLALLFIPFGSIYIAVDEFYALDDQGNMIPSMITFSILLIFNVLILEIYIKLSQNYMYEKERTVYAQQISMIAQNTEEQKMIMDNFHKEKHDLTNKLIVLKSILESGDHNAVIQNIDDIIQNCKGVTIISDSGNKVVDAVINVKYAIAREQGIRFSLKVFIPEDLPINQSDLGVVIGNILDNAIDAVSKCNMDEKKIEIIIGIKKEAFVLIVKNPYQHILKKDGAGNYLSTKKEAGRHGYGIRSIKRVVEKYDGDILIDDADGYFTVTVMMNLGGF